LRVLGAVLAMGLLLAGCTTGNAGTSNDLLGSSWLAEDIEGRGVMDILQTTIGFAEDDRIAGSGGCNNYFGLAVIEGSKISMGPLGSTKKACPPAIMDQEQRFFGALQKVHGYETRDGLLFFYDKNSEPILRFSRLDPN
jgi:heat shock protein HslJ